MPLTETEKQQERQQEKQRKTGCNVDLRDTELEPWQKLALEANSKRKRKL